jgi:hypothetical protein
MPRTRNRARARSRAIEAESVFVNIPYDSRFENLFLAYIAAISALGFVPHATLEIPSNVPRLDRILDLIATCPYSVHDLSRVQLDRVTPSTPRFNMPFELGLALGLHRNTRSTGHAAFVCESLRHRVSKSLSDLNGTDVYIHDGKILGLFRELRSMFVRAHRQPTVQQMMAVYRVLRKNLPDILRRAGEHSPFSASVFRDLAVLAAFTANRIV